MRSETLPRVYGLAADVSDFQRACHEAVTKRDQITNRKAEKTKPPVRTINVPDTRATLNGVGAEWTAEAWFRAWTCVGVIVIHMSCR
jgi:hypothetical protein